MTTPKTPSFASSSSSSTSIPPWKYDVFLSFGEDTSNSFSDHLYHGLKRKGIETFRGYEKLEKGETPNRLKAIDESRLAIVVFSREYPSSAERLDELVKIAEMKLRVFPVFCNVEPSQVRKQNGTFGDAFTLLLAREDLKWKANKWREVLTEMASNAGWELRNKYESEVIEEIAQNISDILNSTSSSGDDDLVGIKYRIVKLLPYLGIGESDDVRVTGIWGMPGVGKTTLAQEVFERIRNCFEASCFIENVSEKFKSKCDVVALQKIVFKELLNEEHPKIQNSREGMKKLRDRLRSRKVLIILDDADESDQIKNLTGDRNLKPGSRIIVTTRNNRFLKEFGENNVFKVDNLAQDEALKLLSKRAFNKEYPPKEYEEVCKLVVRYAGGLPLALNVLGSFLVKSTVKEWFSTLDRLQEYLDEEDIVCVLRISVDGLKVSERELFLDIACFFKGEPRHRVEKILTRDRGLSIDIEVLVEKALIRIGGKDSCLWMHDLLQELGWEYVRRKHFTMVGGVTEKLGERSRLWVPNDIIDVLTENSGTEAVKGIFLTFPEKKDVALKYDPFPKMRKLKLLKIHNANFSKHPTYLCNELQLLEWHDYQSTSLPSSFQPENLVELNLPNSSIEQLWEESGKVLKKLLWINLSYCRCLTQTINFSTAPNLERLNLKGCGKLSEVHPSIEVLKNLVSLNLEGCNNLSSLPGSICGLTSLRTLYLCGCSHLDHLPENLGGLEQLEVLDASGTGIRKVPSSITDLKNLIVLSFSGCKGVALDAEGCSEPIGLQLPNSFSGLVSLRSLDLSGCNLSEGAIPQDIGCLSSLQSLDLSVNNFISIPDSMSKLPKLRALQLNSCHKLRWLPKPPCINLIEARDCAELRNNPNKRTVWTSDGGLCLIDCSNLDEEKNDMKLHLTQIPLEHYPLQLRKYFKDAIYQGRTAQLVESIGDRVPGWCSHSRNASSITVQLSGPNLDGDSTWMGIALYIVYKNPKQKQVFDKRLIESAGFPGFDMDMTELKFHFETEEGRLGKYLVDNVSIYGGSDGLFRYVPREWFSVEFHLATSITASVSFSDPKLEVKMCGAHVVTKQNVAEFTGNLCKRDGNEEYAAQHFNEIIDNVVKSKVSINEMESAINECLMIGNKRLIEWRQLSTSKCPPPETSRNECSSPNPFFIHIEETNSLSSDTSKLRRDELKPLLSDLFEGNPARNFCACIFPVKAILPRFTYQCVGNQAHCCLPEGLYDDKTWLGISLYVVLTWHPSASLNDFDLKDQPPMLSVDMEVLGVEIFTEQFPLKKDDLVGLNRLVLFYMPRVAFSEFWLKKGCSISSLFRTTIPDEVDIEICGISLVYEEELEEIIETVSECTLHSPEIYHQRYCRNFAKMKNGESTIGERVMLGGEMTIDLGFARCFRSNLNSSNQQEPEQSSNSKRDIVEKRLLQKYFQGFDQWSTYNSCFPPSEIPEWFNDHSNDGPSVKIQLPSNLHDDSNWTGLALWASFCTTESPTVIGDNQFSSGPHFLICNLETNSGRLEPQHVYQTTKEEFKWLHVGGFIWLCYIPRASCFHLLNQCEFLEASFGSDRPDLWAHKSALRLMYKNDGHDLGNIILHCMKIFWDNWDLIAHSATEVTSKHLKPTFIILSMMAETPLHRIDSPTLWQSNLKKLLQHFFKFTLLVNFTIEGHFISTFRGFDPDHMYNFGFPHKEILEWFTYQNCSSHVEMPLPQKDLCNDSNWAGLVMCAYFEVQEPPTVILEDFGSRIYARLLCHLQLQDKCLDSGPMFDISKEKFKWFYLRGFIWITYIPRLSFPDVLNNVMSVEASFHSPDCSSLVAKKCGIRLLYQHEVEEFKQTIIQYITSFFDYLTPICEYISDENEKKYHPRNREISGIFRNPFLGTQHKRSRESTSHGETFGVDNSFENLHHSKRTKLHNQVEARELQDFDRNVIYNSVFPCVEIIDWFSHHDGGSAVSIQQLPQSLESDNNWIGLALCAYFSNFDDPQPTTFIDHMDTDIRHHLISQLQSDRGSLEQLLIYRTNNEEFKWLNHRGQFFWLLFIPRKYFLGKLNECSSLKATFVSDNGSLCVKQCGLRLVYRHQEDEFKQRILHCVNSFAGEESTNQDNVGEVGSSATASSLNIDSQGQQEEARGRPNDFKSKGKRVME